MRYNCEGNATIPTTQAGATFTSNSSSLINSNIIHDVNILFQERRALCLRMPVVAGFQTEPFTIFML